MNKSTSKISCFVIFIAFLMSMRCWIGFEGRHIMYFYALLVILFLLNISGKLNFIIQRRAVIFALMLYIVRLYFSYKATGSISINGIINQAFLPFIAAHNGLFRFSEPFIVEVQNLFNMEKEKSFASNYYQEYLKMMKQVYKAITA